MNQTMVAVVVVIVVFVAFDGSCRKLCIVQCETTMREYTNE